jgi:3-carboxy-cis,cis-muconate cycloisomerase
MLDDALQRACALTGDLLVRLEVILSGLVVDPVRMRANLGLTGGMISSEAVMLGLGRARFCAGSASDSSACAALALVGQFAH